MNCTDCLIAIELKEWEKERKKLARQKAEALRMRKIRMKAKGHGKRLKKNYMQWSLEVLKAQIQLKDTSAKITGIRKEVLQKQWRKKYSKMTGGEDKGPRWSKKDEKLLKTLEAGKIRKYEKTGLYKRAVEGKKEFMVRKLQALPKDNALNLIMACFKNYFVTREEASNYILDFFDSDIMDWFDESSSDEESPNDDDSYYSVECLSSKGRSANEDKDGEESESSESRSDQDSWNSAEGKTDDEEDCGEASESSESRSDQDSKKRAEGGTDEEEDRGEETDGDEKEGGEETEEIDEDEIERNSGDELCKAFFEDGDFGLMNPNELRKEHKKRGIWYDGRWKQQRLVENLNKHTGKEVKKNDNLCEQFVDDEDYALLGFKELQKLHKERGLKYMVKWDQKKLVNNLKRHIGKKVEKGSKEGEGENINDLIGRKIQKKFNDGNTYFGIIKSGPYTVFDKEKNMNVLSWSIEYDDGDVEDMDRERIEKYIV